jgi:hypothetical protein
MKFARIISAAAAIFAFAPLLIQASTSAAVPGQPGGAPSATGPLSLEQVVDNLVRKNLERADALLHSESTRKYRLVYHGFPGEREAEMTVRAVYDRPARKEFKVLSQSGSKVLQDRVFKSLLEGEKEAMQPAISARSQLNRENYDFKLLSFEPSPSGGQYVLQVSPRAKNKYLYRGKIWVDGTDFAVTHIEAEPVQNPSFWTRKNEFRHDYKKVDSFWVPVRNESTSYIRLGGRAILTIEYSEYRVIDARRASKGVSISPLAEGQR